MIWYRYTDWVNGTNMKDSLKFKSKTLVSLRGMLEKIIVMSFSNQYPPRLAS